MAKKMKKIMSMMLVLCMMVSMFSVTVFASNSSADEFISVIGNDSSLKTEQIVEGNLVTDVTTTTTTSTDENGNVTVNVSIEKVTTGTDENGTTVNGKEVREETTVTDEAGDVVSGDWVVDGSETKEWSENVQPGQEVPEVEATITGTDENGNQIISGSATSDPVITTEGDTTTTTTTEREVEGTVKVEESFEIIGDESKLECPVGPEDYEGKGYYDYSDDKCDPSEKKTYDVHYREGLLKGYYSDGKFYEYDKDILSGVNGKPDEEGYEKGFDLTWTGYGDITDGASPAVGYVKEGMDPYLRDGEGNIVYENGFPVYNMESFDFVAVGNKMTNDPDTGYKGTGMFLQPVQFALKHENGEYFYAYCMDAATGASPTKNRWYNINNLEDAIDDPDNPDDDGYLTEDEAAMIRAIATNGYWGNEVGRGSVDSLKELLKSTYGEDEVFNVRYQGSNEIAFSYKLSDIVDGLTEAEALAATQAAIWSFSNSEDFLGDGATLVSLFSASKYHNGSQPEQNGFLGQAKPAKDGESDARMQALFKALLKLEPIYADGELREDSTVIPNEGVVSDVAIVVQDKIENEAANLDDNKDNDVYNTAVNFKLAFVPGEKDEMYVLLMDGNNQPILGEDGQPIKKLLASESSTKEGEDVIKPVNGVYTLTGLKISENSNFEFDLRLEGTQYLNEGVYIYQAEGGRRESQTLVGLAKGEQKIAVSNKMTISFNVDEENHVVAQRVWHDEGSVEAEVVAEPTAGVFAIPARPLNNIPDEEVPLADAPQTGDEAIVFAVLTVLAGISLMAMHVSEKKRKEEV